MGLPKYNRNQCRLDKIEQNQDLARLMIQTMNPDHVKALVIDTREGHTVRTLLEAGVHPVNITVVNYSQKELDVLLRSFPDVVTFAGSFEAYVCSQGATSFDFIYYDSCNTLQTAYQSLWYLFANHWVSSHAIIAVTLSSRGRRIDPKCLADPFKLQHWRTYENTDNIPAYLADQLVKDYAHRNSYTTYRLTWENAKAQYKPTVFQLVYELKII